jgi:hypothetical protein
LEDLDNYANALDLLETVQAVAEENLQMPRVGASKPKEKKSVPGWKEAVRPYREEAYFWHQVWQSYGRPLNTDIHTAMKKSKNKYHYEFKKCQKAEDKIRRNKL